MKNIWVNSKKVLGFFAIALLLVGFFLLDKGISGNVIFEGDYASNPLSLIGLIIVVLSAILTAYIIISDNRKG